MKEQVLKFLQAHRESYLKGVEINEYLSPTFIGLHFGNGYTSASSWACSILKRLIKDGTVIKNSKKFYRAK